MRVLHGQALLISVLVLSTVLLGIGLLSVTMLVTSSQSMITLANKRIAAAAATAVYGIRDQSSWTKWELRGNETSPSHPQPAVSTYCGFLHADRDRSMGERGKSICP